MGGAKNYHAGHAMSKHIETQAEYNELATMADTAEECLQSLRFGSHAFLIRILYTKYEIRTDRLGAIKAARKLCKEYMDAIHYEKLAEAE